MSKRKILLSLIICLFVLASASAIYAFANKIDLKSLTPNSLNTNTQDDVYICVSEVTTNIETKKMEDILNATNKYIPTLIENNSIQTASVLTDNSSELKTFHDNSINQDYYDVITSNYTLSLAEDTTLRAFSDNTFDYDIETTTDETVARTFITNFYNNLDISHDYELEYLEIFDDSMWEADFVKKIDGIYNYYDSIKIFFSPNQQKIAALRVHSTPYANAGIATASTTISEADAIDIVKNNFSDISDNEITNTELVFVKPNNFFTREPGSEIIPENNVTKAWKVTIEDNSTTTYIFIDLATGNIVGGDQVK